MSQQPAQGDGFVVTRDGRRVGKTEVTQEAANRKASELRQKLNESPSAGSNVAVKQQLNG